MMTPRDILRAATCVYDVACRTSISQLTLLSHSLVNDIRIKREDQQEVFSFKLRGAYNTLYRLPQKIRARGVVACSAGNHGQGVALSATKLNTQATVIMPTTTPELKVAAVQRFGGHVQTHGNSFDEAQEYAHYYAKEQEMHIVHPFDDVSVMAGQGTIALELANDLGWADYVFIPVGGGGLLAGMACYLKYIWPNVQIIAVEEEHSACLDAALRVGKPVALDSINIFADGIAVSKIGTHTFDILHNNGTPLVDACVQVNVDAICAAMKDIYTDIRAIAEPAGAVAVAGIKKFVQQYGITNKRIATVLTGANVNFDRLNYVTERSALGEQKESIFAVMIPEQAGSFLHFCRLLGKRNITEFNYRYHDKAQAVIYVGIKLLHETGEDIAQLLTHNGYTAYSLTNDEIAKVHVRHMVGGRAVSALTHERLYRFQFPEFPGALLQFLERIGTQFNISLFHYRNNSSAWGSVLAGIEVSDDNRTTFEQYLTESAFRYSDETDSDLNRLFFAS